MISRLSLLSIIAALFLTQSYASHTGHTDNTTLRQQAPIEQQRYESFALQMNVNDRGADRVFEMGNCVYEFVNGVVKKDVDGSAVKVDGKVQYLDNKATLGRLFHVGPNVKGNDVYLICEQTTASPHATLAVYSDVEGKKLDHNRIRCMHPALSVAHREMEKLALCGGQSQSLPLLKILHPVLIASFLDQNPQDDVWLRGTCDMRQNKPSRTNVYFQFNSHGKLVGFDHITGQNIEFTAMSRALARAFIVLECDIVNNRGTSMEGHAFLNKMEESLNDCERGKNLISKNKVFKKKLLHITLAKLSGVKDSAKFKNTSREELLFPIANRNGSFEKIQNLFARAVEFCDQDMKKNGNSLVCDKLVVNPVSVSEGADHRVLSFKPDDKRVSRANTDWTQHPRLALNLLTAVQSVKLMEEEHNNVQLMTELSNIEAQIGALNLRKAEIIKVLEKNNTNSRK